MNFFLSTVGLAVIDIIEKNNKKYCKFSRFFEFYMLQNWNYLDFGILFATLKVNPACSACRMTTVESAFDKVLIEAYNHEKFRWYTWLELSF